MDERASAVAETWRPGYICTGYGPLKGWGI